jgi:hypothetical protein
MPYTNSEHFSKKILALCCVIFYTFSFNIFVNDEEREIIMRKLLILGIIGSLVVQTVFGAVALKKEMTGDAVFIKPNSNLIASPADLARVLENTQEQFLPISPPSMEMLQHKKRRLLWIGIGSRRISCVLCLLGWIKIRGFLYIEFGCMKM